MLLSSMGEEEIKDLLLQIVESSQASLLTRNRIFDVLETQGHIVKGFKKVWEFLKTISYEKKLTIKY